jgi:peptidoglycan-associated lipoprotein
MNPLLKITVIGLSAASLLVLNTGCRRNKTAGTASNVDLSGIPSVDLNGGLSESDLLSTDPLLGQRNDNVPYAAVPGLEPVYFDYDRSDLRPSESVKVDNAAAYFRQNSGLFVLVEGHTDERGSNEYNLGLGERRALAIRDALIQRGVEAGRIQTLSKGEEFPVVMGQGDSVWSRNRRAEFLAGQ